MLQTLQPQPNHHYYFVTGRLAEAAVREIVNDACPAAFIRLHDRRDADHGCRVDDTAMASSTS